LKGPKKDRRHFIYCSAELNLDKTLSRVRDNEKYKDYFHGVDISESAIKDSDITPEEFFAQKVKMKVDTAPPGTILCCDDFRDSTSAVADKMRRLIDRTQRCGRHRKLGLIFILHRLRSGVFSNQAYSSCKYITVFPRSQKNKVRDLLENEYGFTKKEARRTVSDFAQTGRACWIHCHAPMYIANDNLLRLI
jgi:RecA-family ATPase